MHDRNPYLSNTALYHIDRGHLLPNHITNYDQDWQRTTMSLTNVAAQVCKFENLRTTVRGPIKKPLFKKLFVQKLKMNHVS